MKAYNNLLRPKKELYATSINSILCVTSLAFRELLVFTPQLGYACAVFFFANASVRGRQSYVLFQYHRNLVSSRPFTLKSSALPNTPSAYYIGKGFEWTPEHTKRLKDLYKRKNMDFMYETRTEKRIKQWSLINKNKKIAKNIYKFVNSHHPLNPYPPRNPTGNSAIHGVGLWEKEEKIYIDLLFGKHILIAGGTGTGKSTTMMEFIQQDINAGRTTLVFDPKGGYKVFSAMYDAIQRNDLNDTFIIIILSSPEYSAQYNAFSSYHRITEVATRLSQGIESEENFKQFAWLKINYIAICLHYIGRQPTMENIKYYVHRCDELLVEYCKSYFEKHTVKQGMLDEVLAEFEKNISHSRFSSNEASHSASALCYAYTAQHLISEGHLTEDLQLQNVLSYIHQNVFHEKKLVANIDPILEKLTAGSIAKILVPDYDNLDSDKPILEMRQLLTEGGNVYFGMNALGDITVSSAFIQIVLEDLNSQLGQFYQYGSDYGRMSNEDNGEIFLKQEVAIHIDELSAVRTKAIRNLLARSGELGVRTRLYTQSHADLVLSLGSEAEAETVIDNVGVIIMHRTNNPKTAQMLTSRLNKVEIEKVGNVHGYTDSSNPSTEEDFSSSSMQREDEIETMLVEDGSIQSLPTGEAFMLVNGNKLYKIKVPLVTTDTRHAPDNINEMLQVLKEQERRYGHQQVNWEDDWFKINYPEYTSLPATDQAKQTPNSEQVEPKSKESSYIPNTDINVAMQEEAGSAAAEFSAMSDVTS